MQIVAHFPNPFGQAVWHLRETTSTMDETARLLAASADPESLAGVVVMADYQSAGRGRFDNRKWQGGAGDGLYFTIILKPTPGFPLSLCLGLAVCHFLESHDLRPKIKWPNDILLDDQKLAGILVMGTSRIMQCGIGLNLRTSGFQPAAGQRAATCLADHGLNLKAQDALAGLLPFLFEVTTVKAQGLQREIEKRLWILHQTATVTSGFPQALPITGIVRGLSAQGALLMELPSGLREIHNGE